MDIEGFLKRENKSIEEFLEEHKGTLVIIRKDLNNRYFFFNPSIEDKSKRITIGRIDSVVSYINEKNLGVFPTLNWGNYYLARGGSNVGDLCLAVFIHEEILTAIEKYREELLQK